MLTHHATLSITKAPHEYRAELLALYQEEAEAIEQLYTTLSIGDVRALIAMSYQTPGDKVYRLLIIETQTIAVEAQQALLKLLEEPPKTTRFVFIMPDSSALLPTVLSRFAVVRANTTVTVSSDFTQFLSSSVPERIAYIAEVAKKKDDEVFTAFFSGLVAATEQRQLKLDAQQLVLVAEALRSLRLRGSSKKMWWEELAFTLPVVK